MLRELVIRKAFDRSIGQTAPASLSLTPLRAAKITRLTTGARKMPP